MARARDFMSSAVVTVESNAARFETALIPGRELGVLFLSKDAALRGHRDRRHTSRPRLHPGRPTLPLERS